MQGIANDRPEIAQRIIENHEKSIGATGFEPATKCSQSTYTNKAIIETYSYIKIFREISMD